MLVCIIKETIYYRWYILNSWLLYGWGSDPSTSQQETEEEGTEWWDQSAWDGFVAGDGGNEEESMSLQELETSLVEAGYLAAETRPRHHPHRHRPNQEDERGSTSQEATTSNRAISESSLPCMCAHYQPFSWPPYVHSPAEYKYFQ